MGKLKEHKGERVSDEQIMSRLQAGEEDDFRLLIRRYEESLRAFCLFYCRRDTGLAREMAQDIFVRVYEKRDDYDSRLPFRPWFFTLARNHVLNQLDKLKRRRRRFFGLVFDRAGTDQSPEEQLLKKEQSKRLRALLEDLPFKQREIVGMVLQGLKPKEIGGITGDSEASVRNNLMRGIRSIRKRVTKKGSDL